MARPLRADLREPSPAAKFGRREYIGTRAQLIAHGICAPEDFPADSQRAKRFDNVRVTREGHRFRVVFAPVEAYGYVTIDLAGGYCDLPLMRARPQRTSELLPGNWNEMERILAVAPGLWERLQAAR